MKHAAQIALLALLATATGAVPAGAAHGPAIDGDAADDRLVPSEASGHDCSADARIEVVPDKAMRRLHTRVCEATVQPAHRASCGELAGALRSVRFVTDHCAGPEEPLEVSLGGRSYRLLRIGTAPGESAPALAGTFSGDGLRMQVQPGRVIREHLDEGEHIGVEQEVVLTLTLDGATRTLPAVYSDGP